MKFVKSREALKTNLAILWLLFTVTFAVWWFKLSLDHVTELAHLQPSEAERWEDQRRMILWEGTAWLFLLAAGGGSLIFLVKKENERVQTIRGFFASFSHEVKTSLASLRLQAESLKDDLRDQRFPVLDRLIADTVRLQLQLENSLFFASQNNIELYVQKLSLRQIIERMREQWPGLQFEVTTECYIQGDDRAIRTIFSNLIQNAMVHGRAKNVRIEAQSTGDKKIVIRFEDDGKGFTESAKQLGQLFHRPTATSGSGLGLYIARLLSEQMGGSLMITGGQKGFAVEVTVPGEIP